MQLVLKTKIWIEDTEGVVVTATAGEGWGLEIGIVSAAVASNFAGITGTVLSAKDIFTKTSSKTSSTAERLLQLCSLLQ